MVNFNVNVYNETSDGIIGAEVTVYSDEGDVIDTISITNAEQLQELQERLNALDTTYLTQEELQDIITNINESYVINATKLNGLSSDKFAKTPHTHNQYAPKEHTGLISSASTAGHVKTINHLNSARFISGEVLSAYQGKLLNEKVNNHQSTINYLYNTVRKMDIRVKVGREGYTDHGENGTRVMIHQGEKIYVRLYSNNPDLNLAGREIRFLINGVIYSKFTEHNHKVLQTINLDPGTYLIFAVVIETGEYNKTFEMKNVIVS